MRRSGPISPEDIIDKLRRRYDGAVANLRADLRAYLDNGTVPSPAARREGRYAYPELTIRYAGEKRDRHRTTAFGRLVSPGVYSSSITRPDLFAAYLSEQLKLLDAQYEIEAEIGYSRQEIPFPYVLDAGDGIALGAVGSQELARHFPTTDLADIGDEAADGLFVTAPGKPSPLALFDALRTDFSLARLRHYTGTAPEHFQRFVLFTNYHRYIDEFVGWGCREVGKGRFKSLAGAGGLLIDQAHEAPGDLVADSTWRKHQMPAYHLIGEDRSGISLVNIGVGPSNAKTITDHLAVLRPEAFLMIGHCGGLRPSQRIGDFVLAHAYLRDDHILDDVLPPEIPIPPIAEVQQALAESAGETLAIDKDALKRRMRTGTVVTTDDRNWELRFSDSALRFSQSRAVAIDMESATIAAQGYRFRVPYGTLLCVSDKPLHGEIKLPGQANRFYEESVSAHLQIGIAACEKLRQTGAQLHSRKLRAFNEPPFR